MDVVEMKKILVVPIVCMFCITMSGQIMGYESPVTMPSMSIYDNSLQMMYIQGLREQTNRRNEYNEYILSKVIPIIETSVELINEKRYKQCIDLIDETFRTYTFYTYQRSIYCHLEYLKGACYAWLEDTAKAFGYWNEAEKDGSEEAKEALNSAAHQFYDLALELYRDRNYNDCLKCLDIALSTGRQYAFIYILSGEAYEALENFDYAKQMYKIAKKLKSSEANNHIMMLNKKIKQHKKAQKRKKD
jgi:tetratricopeptide (TPR) repeat protein